jgi:hypothetical protein
MAKKADYKPPKIAFDVPTGMHQIGAVDLCLPGLLSRSGQNRIDGAKRESGTHRDFSRSDSDMPVQ